MHEASGTISGTLGVVQESRFTLIDGQGAGHLFLLGHASLAEPSQLADLQRRQARIRVSYTAAADILAHVARRIEIEDS